MMYEKQLRYRKIKSFIQSHTMSEKLGLKTKTSGINTSPIMSCNRDRNLYCVLNLSEGPYFGERGFISGSPRGGMNLWPVYNASSICSDSNMPCLGFK